MLFGFRAFLFEDTAGERLAPVRRTASGHRAADCCKKKRKREKRKNIKKNSNRGGRIRDTFADLNECRENPAEFIGILEVIENTST